jgi:hypothetical protein
MLLFSKLEISVNDSCFLESSASETTVIYSFLGGAQILLHILQGVKARTKRGQSRWGNVSATTFFFPGRYSFFTPYSSRNRSQHKM